jgi:hypothetical protein
VTATGALRATNSAAGRNASLASTAGLLDVGSLRAGGTASLAAAVQISGGTLRSGGAMRISAPTVTVNDARSDTAMTVDAVSLIDAGLLGAQDIALATGGAGSVRLGRAEAVTIAIVSGAHIDAAALAVRDRLQLAAGEMKVGSLAHTGSAGPLLVDVTGPSGTEATRFDATLVAPFGAAFGDYRVADAEIATTGTLVTFDRGFSTGTLTLRTAARNIFLNNRAATPVAGFDVQLFQPTFAFRLRQDGMSTTTDAFIVNFGEGSEVFFERNGTLFAGMSMVREFEKAMQVAGSAATGGAGTDGGTDASPAALFNSGGMARPTASFMASFLAAQTRQSLVVNGDDEEEPAVNLDGTVTNSSQQ